MLTWLVDDIGLDPLKKDKVGEVCTLELAVSTVDSLASCSLPTPHAVLFLSLKPFRQQCNALSC